MNGSLSMLNSATFYAKAANLRIRSYYNLGNNLDYWRKWLAFAGPILTRLGVDRTWDKASTTRGHLDVYRPNTVRGGHAVCRINIRLMAGTLTPASSAEIYTSYQTPWPAGVNRGGCLCGEKLRF